MSALTRLLRSVTILSVAASTALLGPAPSYAAAPTHSVTVSGTGVTTFPAYAEGTSRYGIATTSSTDGTVVVNASTSDPAGKVQINGALVESGKDTTLTGLSAGDEVAVIFTDSAGTTAQSWIYLPYNMPVPTVTKSAGASKTPVALTLASFGSQRSYETIVNRDGVPLRALVSPSADLKPAPAKPGHYTVARADAQGVQKIYELDGEFNPVHSWSLTGDPAATDFHDAELLPDGRMIVLGYASDGTNLNSVIQIQQPDGTVDFEWNSIDHGTPSEAYVDLAAHPALMGDWSHINSVQIQPNGDLIASFRNLSQVMRIATVAHDGFSPGDVVWRLGGKRNDFTFVADVHQGPCAQHTAYVLPNGNLTIFDNGSSVDPAMPLGGQAADMCPDPANPGGAGIARQVSRVTEYSLNESTKTATLVRSYQRNTTYSPFAGSQQRLDNGNWFIGWALGRNTFAGPPSAPTATEVDDADNEVWSISYPGFFSYRATTFSVPDKTAPRITLTGLASGTILAEGDEVPVSVTCTDTGGSGLQTCDGAALTGVVDTSTPGDHTLKVTATDGDGNTTTESIPYSVGPNYRPDLSLALSGTTTYVGTHTYATADTQTLTTSLRRGSARSAKIRVTNDGAKPDQIRVVGTAGTTKFRVRYYRGSLNITRQVLAGKVTPVLASGATWSFRVRVTRLSPARSGDLLDTLVTATSLGNANPVDEVRYQVKAR